MRYLKNGIHLLTIIPHRLRVIPLYDANKLAINNSIKNNIQKVNFLQYFIKFILQNLDYRCIIKIMTANVFKEDIDRCLKSGMNDHLAKPIEIDEVLDKILVYCNIEN